MKREKVARHPDFWIYYSQSGYDDIVVTGDGFLYPEGIEAGFTPVYLHPEPKIQPGEPVVWIFRSNLELLQNRGRVDLSQLYRDKPVERSDADGWLPLYLHPEPSREPVAWAPYVEDEDIGSVQGGMLIGVDHTITAYARKEQARQHWPNYPLAPLYLAPPSREREVVEKIVNCLRWVDAVMDGRAAKLIPEHKELSEEVRETLRTILAAQEADDEAE